jgi:CheY-like chemotaxis protein
MTPASRAGTPAFTPGFPASSLLREPTQRVTVGQQANSDFSEPIELPQPRSRVDAERFTLCHRRGTVAVLDDDEVFTEALALQLPPDWPLQAYSNPKEFVEIVKGQTALWEDEYWAHQNLVGRWRAAGPGNCQLIPLIIDHWRRTPARMNMLKVCMVDQHMPTTTGLQVLSQLSDWPGTKILLSGFRDDGMVATAFNHRLIDRAVNKTTDLAHMLRQLVRGLLQCRDDRANHIWSDTFAREQLNLLRVPSISQELTAFAHKTWVEWICIGEPFGILGLDVNGVVSWLQLEPVSQLAAASELAGVYGASASQQNDIRCGRSLSNVELIAACGLDSSAMTLQPAFHVGSPGTLLASLTRVDLTNLGGPLPGMRQVARKVPCPAQSVAA